MPLLFNISAFRIRTERSDSLEVPRSAREVSRNARIEVQRGAEMTMPSDYAASHSNVLNSWKEVASYLGRGVRTVQRWEQELGLPIRRPRGKARSAVLALRTELDSWLLHSAQNATSVTKPKPHSQLYQSTEILTARARLLLARSIDLCERSRFLSEQINRAIATAFRRSRIPENKKVADAAGAVLSPPDKLNTVQTI